MESSINERIKLLRSSLNFSQLEFASAIDSTITSVSRMENGQTEPRKSTLKLICKTFSVPESWLIDGIGEMSFSPKEISILKDSNPWKDALVTELKEEIQFLRGLVNKLSTNFHDGIDLAGLFQMGKPVNTVRVAS